MFQSPLLLNLAAVANPASIAGPSAPPRFPGACCAWGLYGGVQNSMLLGWRSKCAVVNGVVVHYCRPNDNPCCCTSSCAKLWSWICWSASSCDDADATRRPASRIAADSGRCAGCLPGKHSVNKKKLCWPVQSWDKKRCDSSCMFRYWVIAT